MVIDEMPDIVIVDPLLVMFGDPAKFVPLALAY
jgi:hypothetical protein